VTTAMATHYEVLGIAPSAPTSEVRRAYVDLARRHHPDSGGDTSRMQAVNEAWQTLRDPARRAHYDRTLPGRPSEPTPAAAPSPRSEADDLLADLADDAPVGGRTVVLPRWLSLVPVGTFGLSVAAFCLALMFSSNGALAASVVLFLLSCLMFLAAPFVALLTSRRARDRR
jgi:hypothetical protein